MNAELEIVGAILRIWPDNAKFPEPFEIVLYIVGDEKTAILKGLKLEGQVLTTRHKNAIMECLKRHGFTKAVWYRWKNVNGEMIRKEISVTIPHSPLSL